MRRNKNKNNINETLSDRAASIDTEHEVELARSELYKIADYAIKLHDMLKNVSEQDGIDSDMQIQISKAAEYLDEVFHTMDYDMKPDDFDIGSELSIDDSDEYQGSDETALDTIDPPLESRPSRSLESRQYKKFNIKESVNNDLKEIRRYDHKLTSIFNEGTKNLDISNIR